MSIPINIGTINTAACLGDISAVAGLECITRTCYVPAEDHQASAQTGREGANLPPTTVRLEDTTSVMDSPTKAKAYLQCTAKPPLTAPQYPQ